MTFAWPHLLWLLLGPLALLWWEVTRRRRAAADSSHPKILRAEAGVHSLQLASDEAQVSAAGSLTGPRIRIWLFLGLSFAILALARPQWGRLEEPVFDQSREILLAVDLSRSMLTQDVKPSRLERAKLLIQSLLEKLQGERVGLVVFSGTAFLQSPLSADYEILREFLPSLTPDFLPEGGTNYRALIDTAIQAFGTSGSADRFLIILSDGEATDDDWRSQIDELKKKGVRVIGLGVGTAVGAMIPDGSGGFIKDDRGAVVLSKLESGTLQDLAQATGGVYQDASAWIDLAALIKRTVDAGRKGQFVEKNTVHLVERFQWPLGLALWCLLVSFYYEFPVRPRVRDIKLGAANTGNRKPDTRKVQTTAVAIGVIFISGLRFPASGMAAVTVAAPAAAAPGIANDSAMGKLFGRLAKQDKLSAQDYAEIGHETLLWGQRLKEKGEHVPAGPVRDALQAVDELMKIDSRSADWTALRSDLEKLLEEEEKKKDQQQKQQNQDKQEQQKQDQSQQQQQQNQQNGANKQDQQSPQNSSEKKDSPEQQQQDAQKKEQKQSESAFGNMQDKADQPPPPPQDTQKVGGAQQKKDDAKEAADPALALPLQKLDQLRNQDSPAQLFQLMQQDKKAPKKPAKDW